MWTTPAAMGSCSGRLHSVSNSCYHRRTNDHPARPASTRNGLPPTTTAPVTRCLSPERDDPLSSGPRRHQHSMQETLPQVEFRYCHPEGNTSRVCYDNGEFIEVTPIVCIAMYLQGAWTHNVSPAVPTGHKPDTSTRPNTFTPALLHGAFESSPNQVRLRFSFDHLIRKPMFAEDRKSVV